MIGIDQEPSRDALAALNGALGEGKYQIAYEETPNGVKAIVRTHDKPSRSWHTRFSSGLAREQVDAVWQEFTSRISKSEGKVEPEQGTTHADPNDVAVAEEKAAQRDNARVEGGTGTADNPAPGGVGSFESSTADEGGAVAPSPAAEPEGSHTDPRDR